MSTARTDSIRATRDASLDEPWPYFLDLLDSSPAEAWEGFYAYAWRLVQLQPPRPLRSLPEEEREDLLADIIQDFQESNFRLLRTYENEGKPFSAWFWRTLWNRAVDRLKYLKRRRHEGLDDGYQATGTLPDRLAEARDMLDHVRSALTRLSPQCQLVLQAAAEGYTSRELQVLLQLPRDENKKLSDQLRYCRRRLVDELAQLGIEVTE